MNKITFDRIDVNGNTCKKEDLEHWYIGEIKRDIEIRLKKIQTSNKSQKICKDTIITNLDDILCASPQDLEKIVLKIKNLKKNPFINDSMKGSNDFGSAILKAFNYSKYRQSVLVELAKKLNVKTCPYCNMQFTLYAEEQNFKSVKFAKLQFDHFYDKIKYPMFSMSLYNLIPSCAVCNQSKRNETLSLNYHPYYSDIHTKFHFEVSDPKNFLFGVSNIGQISIKLVAENDTDEEEFKKYKDVFHLDALYSRHKDFAQEIFDKAYLKYYYDYEENFIFLQNKNYFLRLILGIYPDKENIDKRPMSKFIQDLWQQANIRA